MTAFVCSAHILDACNVRCGLGRANERFAVFFIYLFLFHSPYAIQSTVWFTRKAVYEADCFIFSSKSLVIFMWNIVQNRVSPICFIVIVWIYDNFPFYIFTWIGRCLNLAIFCLVTMLFGFRFKHENQACSFYSLCSFFITWLDDDFGCCFRWFFNSLSVCTLYTLYDVFLTLLRFQFNSPQKHIKPHKFPFVRVIHKLQYHLQLLLLFTWVPFTSFFIMIIFFSFFFWREVILSAKLSQIHLCRYLIILINLAFHCMCVYFGWGLWHSVRVFQRVRVY